MLDSTPYAVGEGDPVGQHRQYVRNSSKYISTNSSYKEMSLNYLQNTNVSENMTEPMPHHSGSQRKIVKSNNQYNISYIKSPKMEHMGKMIIKSNTFKEITEEKIRDGVPRSTSSTSLDFLVEGERMVSELCNISTEPIIMDTTPPETLNIRNDYICSKCFCNQKHDIETSAGRPVSSVEAAGYDESVPTQIIQLAVEACTAAENIAIANKNRPCFKNIQTICEKTRSNVQKPDSAVANLHSQGVPWVIKNFIFSFVRILDGWKGIKELLCEKHESFKRIENKYYNPQIRESFMEWQIATNNMLNHIYKTFKALDSGFQAEQQRYKQNANGINFNAGQNNKQQVKQVVPTATINQQPFTALSNQWSNGSYGPSPYIAPGMPVCTNIFPQWTHPPTVSNVALMQTVYNGSLSRNDSELNKRTAEKQESKDEIKIINNLDNSLKHPGSWLHQQNKDFLIKYQQTSNDAPQHEEFSKLSLGSGELQKPNTGEPTSLLLETLTQEHNEGRESVPIQNTNYWPSENNYKSSNSIFKTAKQNEFEIFTNRNNQTNAPTNQNITFVNNIAPTCNFESDSEMNEPSKVYMKPGSYNIPIKQCDGLPDSDFGTTVETMTVHNSLMTKGTGPKVLNMPFSKAPISSVPQPLIDCNAYNLMKKNQYVDQNQGLGSVYTQGLGFNKIMPKLNEGYITCSDKEWEAAKQMAPKLLTTMYGTPISKSNAQRLYEALAPIQLGDNRPKSLEEFPNTLYVDSVSWNQVSQKFFGENSQHVKNFTFDTNDLLNSPCSETNTLSPEYIKDLENICSIEEQNKDLTTDMQSDTTYSIKEQNDKGNLSKQPVSGESCYIEREYASCDTVKKLKKKNNNITVKCTNRKKNEQPLPNGIKKMESILFTMWNMENKIDGKFGLEISKAPHFYEVIKNPLLFSTISERIQKSFYSDVHQVAHDIRSVFYNAYEYLKVYPDEKLRIQVDEMCTYFEKIFSEDILNTNTIRDKSRKHRKRPEFYDEKRLHMFPRDGKKTMEK